MSDKPARVNGYLVAGGRYHDIDFARRELLTLLAEHPHIRMQVAANWDDIDSITKSDFVISYTCDLRPSEASQIAMRDWVTAGGRWLALHGTNAALDIEPPNPVVAPRCFPVWAETLGSQFASHPPIMPYPVEIAAPDHWLVKDIEPFETDDELYLCEYHDRDQLEVLLDTHWNGTAAGFEESDWTTGPDQHLVQYVRPLGQGAVLYNTLGHCRGNYDMAPIMDFYPVVERCSWEKPQYYELLRRGIRWALGHNA